MAYNVHEYLMFFAVIIALSTKLVQCLLFAITFSYRYSEAKNMGGAKRTFHKFTFESFLCSQICVVILAVTFLSRCYLHQAFSLVLENLNFCFLKMEEGSGVNFIFQKFLIHLIQICPFLP